MFRRKEKAVQCNSFEAAIIMLQEDERATMCAMQYICMSLIQGLVPPDACLAAIAEGALSSEEHELRARAFQVFKCTYLLGNQLVHWSSVRHAMQQEIANAESASALEASFDLLTSLPVSHLVGWFCSKESAQAMRGAIVLEDIALRAISVRHIGALLVRVWHHVEGTGGAVDALLFATQSMDDRSKHDLTAEEPRRIRENLSDFIKDCYKNFTLGMLGKATTNDAQTGNLKKLSDSLGMFSQYSGALLQLVRCFNENRRGVSLDAWILALVNDGSSSRAAQDSAGVQVSLAAHATSAKFHPFVQVVLHDLLKDMDVLVAKCNMCDKMDAQDPTSLISQIFLALLHEHHRFSQRDGASHSEHQKRYATLLPVFVQTVTKDAFSFGNLDEDGDETNASRSGNGDRVLQHMVGEWAGVHLKEFLLRWREAALPSNHAHAAAARGNQEYVFGQATRISGWRIVHTLVEILQFDVMQASRAELAVEVAEHVLQMLDVEVYCSSLQSASGAVHSQKAQMGLSQAFAMLLLLLRFSPHAGAQLKAHHSLLRLLKLTYIHGHVSGAVCCRLMTELSAAHLQPREEQSDEHVDDVMEAFMTTDTHTTGYMTAFLALDTVQDVVNIPVANPNSIDVVALSCKFNAFLVVAICRVCEASLINAIQRDNESLSSCTIYTQSVCGQESPATPSEKQTRQRCARVLALLTNIKLVLYAFSSCIYWPILLPSGESAQIAWVSLASLALQTLVPLDSQASPLLLWTAIFPEVRLEARKLTTVLIGLLDALLENDWSPSFSTSSRSSILSLLSRGIVVMSKHTIGAGPWHDSAAQEMVKIDKVDRRPSVGAAYGSWTEEPINPLHGEIFARGEDLLRLLEEDILVTSHVLPGGDSGSSPSKRNKDRTTMSAQQIKAVDSIVEISKACLTVEDDAMAAICLDLLNSAVQGDLNRPLRDYVCTKSQEVASLIALHVNGEDSSHDVSAESPRSPGLHSPRPRTVPSTMEPQHKQQDIRETSLFSRFNTSSSDASQDVIAIADDVASSHFPTCAHASAFPSDRSSSSREAPAEGPVLCAPAADGISYSQISGSSDPLTVLAAVEFNKQTLQGTVWVKVVNSSGFKFDGYSVQLLLKSSNWFASVQDVTRIAKTAATSKFDVSSRFSEGASRTSSLPDAYVTIGQEILQDKPLLVSGGLSADVAPGALQHSTHTEYVLHNGTSESTFNFQLKRLGSVEIVIRLKYQDLQEGTPLPDLWSLVKCLPGKSNALSAKKETEDDARFTSEKMPPGNRASTQCMPLRLSVSSQLAPYGRGIFNSFGSAAWTNRMQNWCDPNPEAQLPSPAHSLRRLGSPGIPDQVFSDLWNRCREFSSTAIPLRAACHSSGVQYEAGQSIVQMVDDAAHALERGVAGGLLPGSHYLNLSSRVNLDCSAKPNEFENMAWALQSVWGAEIGIRLCIWFDQGNGLHPGDDLSVPSAHADPLSLPMSLASVHSAELGAVAASSTAAGLVNTAQKQRSIGSYRASLEMRASDSHTIACLLEDIDGFVAALTADVMEVHQAEFEDKFSDSRSVMSSKLNGMRPVGAPVPAVVQPVNLQRGAFGLY